MERARSPGGVLSLVVLVLSMSVLGVSIGSRATVPDEQAYVSIDRWEWTAQGGTVLSVAADTLPADRRLLDGDVVSVIDGRSLESWADTALRPFQPGPSAGPPNAPLRIDVVRGGSPTALEVQPAPFPVALVLADGWPLIVFLGLLVVVSAYIAARRWDLVIARVLLIGSVGNLASALPWQLGLAPTELVRGGPPLLAFILTGPLSLLFWSAALHVVLVFEPSGDEVRRDRLVRLAWAIPPIALVVGVVATRLASGSTLAWIGTWLSVQSAVVGVILTLALDRKSVV